jgi:hypothetical protein
MAKIRIPDKIKPGLKIIIDINQNNFDNLIDLVKSAPAELDIDILLSHFKQNLESLNEKEIEDLLKTLSSLFTFFETSNKKVTEITIDLVSAILSDDNLPGFSDEELNLLEDRLRVLLEISSPFKLASKAVKLLRDNERIYIDASLITDIRPVISKKHDTNLTGALIVHTLKIEYQDINGIQEFYVTLDNQDIQNLRKKLEESEEEINAIKKIVSQANIIHLDPTNSSSD